MKVSIMMITYNHEKFIAQALESVLMQATDFDYEIVIGEDCSTDRTREILFDYQNRFPDKIRLLLPESNLGVTTNLARTLEACRGEYIALLEGDDYWTSPVKLHKQVDFLDSNSDCSMCFHPVIWFYEDGHEIGNGPEDKSVWPKEWKEYSDIEDILKSIFIQTGSVMLRNNFINRYPDWYGTLRMGDWPLFILYAAHGKIGCLSDVMGAYRKHAGGVCHVMKMETMYKDVIEMYHCVNAHLGFKYEKIIRPILADYYFKLAEIYDQRGETELARTYMGKNLAAQVKSGRWPGSTQIKMMARFSFPSLYAVSRTMVKR